MNKNSFAKRPPMGWNSYDYYDTNVTEAEVLANAEFMAEHLKPYGWEYVVVDIQWYAYNTATMRDRFQYIPFGKNEIPPPLADRVSSLWRTRSMRWG